jgi:hypothetical protein
VVLILRGTCLFEDKLNNVQGAGAVAALVYTDAARPEAIPMGTGSARLPASMISHADGVALKARIQAVPQLQITVDFTNRAFPVSSDRLSDSSSSGPSADYAVKPDVLAVGSSVYTATPGGYSIANGTSLSSPLVAGSAALLKAARPGLTAAQYRSLLVNSATGFSVNGGISPLSVQQGGAGLLNVQAAVRGTLAAQPNSLSFGLSGGTVDSAQTLLLTSLDSETDTLTLEAQPIGSTVAPSVDPAFVELGAGATRAVAVRLSAAGLEAGAHQGFLVIRSTRSGRELRLPWWHGVPSNIPRVITMLSSGDPEGQTSSRRQILFRTTDAAGLAVNLEPTLTITEGSGRVTSVLSVDAEIPGAWLAQVRLGAEPGNNTFRIQVGELTRDVTISGN